MYARLRSSALKFFECEGLREVVVGAEFEPGGLVVEPVGGGEHEDGHATAGGDDVLGYLVPGGAGHIAVEDGDVVGARPMTTTSLHVTRETVAASARNLTKIYGEGATEVHALRDVNLDLATTQLKREQDVLARGEHRQQVE